MKLLFATVAALAVVSVGGLECPPFWFPFGGYCYRYFGDRVPWQEALNSCREHFSHNGRADLASIHNVQENSFLYNLFHSSAGDTPLSSPPYYGAWIGLYQTTPGSTGPFIWTDGSPFDDDDYSNWREDQPSNWHGNEDCGHFWRITIEDDITQPWNDLLCTENLPFICKMEP